MILKNVVSNLIGLIITFCLVSNVYGQNKSESANTLSEKQKNIISIAAYTGKGELSLLKSALNDGLDAD